MTRDAVSTRPQLSIVAVLFVLRIVYPLSFMPSAHAPVPDGSADPPGLSFQEVLAAWTHAMDRSCSPYQARYFPLWLFAIVSERFARMHKGAELLRPHGDVASYAAKFAVFAARMRH